jgi:hypothetical protein
MIGTIQAVSVAAVNAQSFSCGNVATAQQKRGPASEQLQAAAAVAPSGNVTGHGYLLIHQTRS